MLGTRFAEYLNTRKISVREAERLMGVGNSTLKSAFDKKSFTPPLLAKISKAFPDFQIEDNRVELELKNHINSLHEQLRAKDQTIEALNMVIEGLRTQIGRTPIHAGLNAETPTVKLTKKG